VEVADVPSELTNIELFDVFERHGFITGASTMVPVLRMARRAALVGNITVLIEGETGTGKQVLAQAIHSLDDKRRSFPFITVHCSTITEPLAESELFGHQRGAFSGATRDRIGLFQAAHRGTLFLDDVNDLPMALQPKLLDVLQRSVVRGVGSDKESAVNVRVIAAANQRLAQAVRQDRFRGDLYHRLNVVRLSLPPLRERGDDLAALILGFAQRHRHIFPDITHVDPELIAFLKSYPFTGNVRELEHSVERMLFCKTAGASLQLSDWIEQCALSTDGGGREEDLVSQAAQHLWTAIQRGVPYNEAIRRLERSLLETVVGQSGQTRREIASRLKTSERTLYHKLRSHQLTRHAVA
jgi:transcriptional regulator with PAS, ATPase and Fis domain